MKIFAKLAFLFMTIQQTQPAFCATYKCESPSGSTIYQDRPCNSIYSTKQTRMPGDNNISSSSPSQGVTSKSLFGANKPQKERLASPPKPWEIDAGCEWERENNVLTPECKRSLESSEFHIKIRNQRKAQCLEALNQLEAKCGAPRYADKKCLDENVQEVLKICE